MEASIPGSTPCKLAGNVANPSHRPVAVCLQRPPHSPRCQACILPCLPGGSLRTRGLLGRRGQLSWGRRACCSCLLNNGTPRPVTMATASTRQSLMGMGTDSLPFSEDFPLWSAGNPPPPLRSPREFAFQTQIAASLLHCKVRL